MLKQPIKYKKKPLLNQYAASTYTKITQLHKPMMTDRQTHILNLKAKRDAHPFKTNTKTLFVVDVPMNWAKTETGVPNYTTHGHMDTWKVTQLTVVRQESVTVTLSCQSVQ